MIQTGNRGGRGTDTQRPQNKFKEDHPDRYRAQAVNPSVDNQIKNLIKGMGGLDFAALEGAVKSSWWIMKECEGIEEGIRPPLPQANAPSEIAEPGTCLGTRHQ